MPSEFDVQLLPYLKIGKDSSGGGNSFARLLATFMDKDRQQARISVSMGDVGTARLPLILDLSLIHISEPTRPY